MNTARVNSDIATGGDQPLGESLEVVAMQPDIAKIGNHRLNVRCRKLLGAAPSSRRNIALNAEGLS